MLELVLSSAKAATDETAVMPERIFDGVLRLMDESGRRSLLLHADWSQPPPYWPRAIERLKAGRMRAIASVGSNDPLEPLRPFWEAGFGVSLCVDGDEVRWEPRELRGAHRLEVFVPLQPDRDLTAVWQLLDALPCRAQAVCLGVSWRDRLSGPRRLIDEDPGPWQEAIEEAVRQSNERGIVVQIACGLPLCLLSQQALGRLAAKRVRWPLASCPVPLLIDERGEVRPCMRLDRRAVAAVGELDSLTRAEDSFATWLAPFRGVCLASDDLACRSLLTGCCGTGCLGDSVSLWSTSATGRSRSPEQETAGAGDH